ncbi:MAG: endonuclease/exonuclease/phosphatase family protein [Paludibacter sp.]|nr:endonuclease/exonuclease/phosphatase family protein [Paludibacter sp.]
MNLGKGLVKIIMFTANLIAVFLMFVSLFTSRVSPDKILLPAYSTLILPLTIALNVGFIFFWLFFRKWFFLISLVTLLISYNVVRNTFPMNFDNASDVVNNKESISLLTYNSHMNCVMAKHTKDKPNPVIQYMLDKDPDILCIQEFSSITKDERYLTDADLMEIFKKYAYKHVYYKVNGYWSKSGIATFSKYPIIYKSTVNFKSNFNSSILSDINVRGKTVRLFNCHLESNNLTENDKNMAIQLKDNLDTENIKGTTLHLSRKLGAAYKVRARQADSISKLVSLSPYPVMVVGDFNDLPSSYAYTKIRGDFKDAFVEKGFGLGWTYSESIFKFRIDHILYDEKIELVDFKLDNKVRYSDHYPLYCKIIL